MRPRSCSCYSSSSCSAYLLIAHLSSGITRQRELETSFRFFVVITGCNDNDNMMLVVKFVVVFMVNFAMNKMVFRVMNE